MLVKYEGQAHLAKPRAGESPTGGAEVPRPLTPREALHDDARAAAERTMAPFQPIALPAIPRQLACQGVILPPAEGLASPKTQAAIAPIFLKRPEAARALGISASLLAKLTVRGEIKAVRIGKRGVRYRPADLEDWANRQAAQ